MHYKLFDFGLLDGIRSNKKQGYNRGDYSPCIIAADTETSKKRISSHNHIVAFSIAFRYDQTNIGCIFTGKKDGKEKSIYIYNVCDHQECYKEVGSQAISYTTGVPAMIGAALVVTKKWDRDGVFTVEEFDPDPYMDMLNQFGLPWVVEENPKLVD